MYSYIKGVITIIEPSYIVLENNGIGYLIYVSNPYSYRINDNVTVYLYQQIREDENIFKKSNPNMTFSISWKLTLNNLVILVLIKLKTKKLLKGERQI